MIQTLYRWYGKKTVWIITAVTVVLVVFLLTTLLSKENTDTDVEIVLPTVKTALVSDIASTNTIGLIGTVRSVNQAEIQTEASGRVTSVRVSIGDSVSAGSIIATLENAAQSAAVLQAEGVYEAALATAAQSTISVASAQSAVTDAENSLINGYVSSYNSANDVLLTTVDDFFSDPEGYIPGLRISGNGYTQTLNSERSAFVTIMNNWQQNTVAVSGNSASQLSVQAESDIQRLVAMIDIFVEIINDQDAGTTIGGVSVESYNSVFIADRSALNTTLLNLQSKRSALQTANENLEKAKLGGSSSGSSVADAQVKQALGSLRAAQANLAKTIIRTPIAGTINSLNIYVGDYVGSFADVAKVANNNALEISAFVGESDLANVAVEDEVLIEDVYTGVVTKVAAGIDSTTQKTEIKIATETDELTNGDSVRIAIQKNNSESTADRKILLPLTAIKFNAENGSVFTVDNGVLVAHEVVLGSVRGSNVEVTEGVTSDMEMVIDARGLSAGAKVEAIK